MKITMNIPEEDLKPIIDRSLENGYSIQSLVIEAVTYYNRIQEVIKEKGKDVVFGYGASSGFSRYNTILDPRFPEKEKLY